MPRKPDAGAETAPAAPPDTPRASPPLPPGGGAWVLRDGAWGPDMTDEAMRARATLTEKE
jgi:hypothetical protein